MYYIIIAVVISVVQVVQSARCVCLQTMTFEHMTFEVDMWHDSSSWSYLDQICRSRA